MWLQEERKVKLQTFTSRGSSGLEDAVRVLGVLLLSAPKSVDAPGTVAVQTASSTGPG